MKKILTLNLIVTILLGLVYIPNASASSHVKTAFNNDSQTRSASQIKQAVLNVQTLSVRQGIVLTQPTLATACKVLALGQSEKDLVQTAAKINLNEPASCFSLVPAAKAVAVNLSVKNLAASLPEILVAINPQTLQSPNIMPAPALPGSLPVLPSVMVIFAVGAVSFKRKVKEIISNFKPEEKIDFSSYSFQILRC